MRNTPLIFARCCATWWALRKYSGVFSLADATKDLRHLLQPGRLTERELRRFIERRLELRSLPAGGYEVRLRREGWVFFWHGQIQGGLANMVRQEVDPRQPHYYTTPPVRLTSASVVLDVGACEGLFAFRVLKQRQAARVHCFEPSLRTAEFLRKAAEANGCADLIRVEVAAVGATTGQVSFSDSPDPEASRVLEPGIAGGTIVPQVALDDYCRTNNFSLSRQDLIKVDAEGADVDVIRGASHIIREGAPQIAVTTYHDPAHADELIGLLRSLQPGYRFRLKGLTVWNSGNVPRPVLLQASVSPG